MQTHLGVHTPRESFDAGVCRAKPGPIPWERLFCIAPRMGMILMVVDCRRVGERIPGNFLTIIAQLPGYTKIAWELFTLDEF